MQMKLFFIVFIFCGFSALASEYQVIPLNSNAHKYLKSSALSKDIAAADQSESDFHQKTLKTSEKISFLFDIKKIDALSFIYDSRFLQEVVFLKKYSEIPRPQLIKARKIASEVYSQ